MGRKPNMVFNPETGKWEPSYSSSNSSSSNVSNSNKNKGGGSNSKPVANTNPTSKVDSQGVADKKYIEIEYNTLEGDVSLVPMYHNFDIKVNQTVQIYGLGNYLSGKYYVSGVKRHLDKDSGYSQELTLIKTGFGDSLKKPSKKSNSNSNKDTGRKPTVPKNPSKFNVGDKVKIVGENAVYSNSSSAKVPDWVKKKTLTVDAISSDGSRARLSPIFSWTYVKYLKKV